MSVQGFAAESVVSGWINFYNESKYCTQDIEVSKGITEYLIRSCHYNDMIYGNYIKYEELAALGKKIEKEYGTDVEKIYYLFLNSVVADRGYYKYYTRGKVIFPKWEFLRVLGPDRYNVIFGYEECMYSTVAKDFLPKCSHVYDMILAVIEIALKNDKIEIDDKLLLKGIEDFANSMSFKNMAYSDAESLAVKANEKGLTEYVVELICAWAYVVKDFNVDERCEESVRVCNALSAYEARAGIKRVKDRSFKNNIIEIFHPTVLQSVTRYFFLYLDKAYEKGYLHGMPFVYIRFVEDMRRDSDGWYEFPFI